MNQRSFDKMFKETVAKCEAILCAKNKEYARNGDKLSNFKKAAAMQGCTPEEALQGMMAKHQISIADYVADFKEGTTHTIEQWDEKIIDALNYLFLLRSLLVEKEES